MKRKKAISLIAVILAVLMLLSLVVSVIPLSAYADEMDELSALRAKKDELTSQVQEIKERILGLQEQKSNVLEQMVALTVAFHLHLLQLNLLHFEPDMIVLLKIRHRQADTLIAHRTHKYSVSFVAGRQLQRELAVIVARYTD